MLFRSLDSAVIDAGTFDWTSGRFPSFTEPSAGFHGLKYSETFKQIAFAVKVRIEVLKVRSFLRGFSAF